MSTTERTSLLNVSESGSNRRRRSSIQEWASSQWGHIAQSVVDDFVPKRKAKRDVYYDVDDNLGVIFRWYGSVWPQVLPWCIVSALFTYVVILLKKNDIVDMTIASNTGHSFMSILVSFLVVTRTTITYTRFMEARRLLADIFRASREITEYACLLTFTNKSARAQKWRQDVAYRTIVALRMAVAAVEFHSQGINAWEALPEEDHGSTELLVGAVHDTSMRQESFRRYNQSSPQRHSQTLTQLAHGPRSLFDENCRAPVVWAYNVRETVLEVRNPKLTILDTRAMVPGEELKILGVVDQFTTAFQGLKSIITTPFPFPLVQMTRTFLFCWVFTLPLVLAADNEDTLEVVLVMFFCSYGFFGLEITSNEMTDAFGTDPNDLPVQRWAENVFEDIYIFIYKTDGQESAMKLRSRITKRIASGNALDNYLRESSDQQQDNSFWNLNFLASNSNLMEDVESAVC